MPDISRRDFVALAAVGAVATPFATKDVFARPSAAVTAQEIVDRVKKNLGVDWSGDDVDTFKIGDPSTVVTGVVTTSMATLEVLQKAVQAGANFVITAAPTFYSKADLSTPAARGLGAGPGAGRGQFPARGTAPGAAAARAPRAPAGLARALGTHATSTGAATSVVPPGQPPAAAAPATPPPRIRSTPARTTSSPSTSSWYSA